MQEWLNWTVSKTVVAQVTVGSNPTLSVFHLFRSRVVKRKRFKHRSSCVLCEFRSCSLTDNRRPITDNHYGAVAQLGECIPRTDEVTGSNPVCSIFNFSLRLNFGRWNYRRRCLNPPACFCWGCFCLGISACCLGVSVYFCGSLQATVWFDAKKV